MTRSAWMGIAALTAVVLSACATPGNPGAPAPEPVAEPVATSATDPSDPSDSSDPPLPPTPTPSALPAAEGAVLGQGTVLQAGDALPQFCLGAVAESYPPQCSGPEILGWDWGLAEQEETASGVTWGTYAVTGTWDGVMFTPTAAPIPLSLYDAMPFEDPLAGRQGTTSRQELDRLQQEIVDQNLAGVLEVWVEQGLVNVRVVYDDGSLQQRMDDDYGTDAVVVRSALHPVT
ncbi:hypothetical protein FJV46_06195 [Arthrobacter agilis]|uniref:hypothetical protein n=1 Tax=Arthrobacter agilis TaxID=37921 RepID=UPI000F7E2BB2|nr:hypothetical protein [Arthrobacter agilis]TPV26465.1 hypothetical protein FJV46_06195 [Arthrobacter agilis]